MLVVWFVLPPRLTVTGESLIRHLDDEAVSPILVWDTTCRDRLSALAGAHWDDWRRRGRVGASLRWVPAYLAEEVLLPEAHSTEPCVAGLYFRLYAAEPGFALEKDMVEGFLVCSVEVMIIWHGGGGRELRFQDTAEKMLSLLFSGQLRPGYRVRGYCCVYQKVWSLFVVKN